MNVKMTVAAIGLVVVASQAKGSLWSMTAPDYQVQVPCIAAQAWTGDVNQDGKEDNYDCAGWWYGYEFHGAFGAGDWSPKNADGSLITTNPLNGEVLPNGNITATGIKITLTTPAAASDDPSGAGMGFDWKNPKGPENISTHDGYCLTYTSSGAPVQMELGWEEGTKGNEVKGFDSWYVTLPAAATSKTVDLKWTGTQGPKVAGDFKKDGWDNTHSFTIQDALTASFSLKFRLKNGTTTAATSTLEIQELGWAGECGGPGAVKTAAASSALNAQLVGRSIAFTGFGKKSVSVEVVSIQGQVVASRVISSSNNSVDLSKVPAGVYVVKASGKGVSLNKMIVLK